jgi:MFS family permease
MDDLLARRRAVVVFLAFAFAYFFAAWLRAITAVLSPTLTREFHLDAGELGLLAGGYFLGFSVTQLPLGTWLDRHGPRKVIIGFLAVAVAGCAAFALADSFAALLVARVLCGAGVSAGLMAPLTGFRRWFDPAAQLRANSWMLMTGSLGMLASTLPVQWLMPVIGWRAMFWGLAALVALAMVLIAWQVPGWGEAKAGGAAGAKAGGDAAPSARKGSYADVWKNATFRRFAPVAVVSYGGMIAMQSLWAGPWMVRVAGYTPLEAATGLFIVNGCMLLTFWTWGLLNPWFVRNGWSAQRLIAWGLPWSFVMTAVLAVGGSSAGAVALALFCMTSTFVSLAQPAVAMAFPAALAGRALSAFNLIIFTGVFVIQWGIGLAIDALRAAGLAEADAFRTAVALFGVSSVMAYGWFLLASGDNSSQDT